MNLDSSPKPSQSSEAVGRLGPIDVLILSAWCGLAAGELEVAAQIVKRALSSTHRLYLMTRHFVWLVPLINLALFLSLGVLLAWATRRWPRRAGWVSPRLILVLTIFPVLAAAGRGIYLEAWLLVALGVASRLAPVLERHPAGLRRRLVWSGPVLLLLVLLQAGWVAGVEGIKQWREVSRPLPPAGAPNVLLIVLDTVRADHLSLYGYPRPTSPNLERLARRGIRFDQARAAAPWTLASHANMFTGRWPHDLAIEWASPLRKDVPTLAEHLGSLGYATAGFAGNTIYCSYDCGLDRGFTHYQDYVLDPLNAARTVKLVDESLKTIGQLGRFWSMPAATMVKLSHGERKGAPVVNREFLDWLSGRRGPGRPFFAFLNYVDAHTPYLLPPGVANPLGSAPRTDAELLFLSEGWTKATARRIPPAARWLAIDAYDNCLAYLDQRLGELMDELQHRGVLDQTLVIVTADHGEGLGEHGLSDHGESLYRTEIHVPLVIVLPADRGRSPIVVERFVSLRDLPATALDQIGPGRRSPFPGHSLARFWADPPTAAPPVETEEVLSELASPNPTDPNLGRSPAHRGPLISLAEGDFVYIRNQGDGGEELFNQHKDPHEFVNLARVEAMGPVLRRFRDHLERARAPAPAARDASPAPRAVATAKFP
jgi:arylsulfatase A-like enzyme